MNTPIRYSEEQRSFLYRLASKLSSNVISTNVDPTKELIRLASENDLNEHQMNRVAQKANVLLTDNHFRTADSKDAEFPVADIYLAKKAISKNSTIKKRIPIESAEVVKEKVSSDYLRTPDEVIPFNPPRLTFDRSNHAKFADAEVIAVDNLRSSRREFEKLKSEKEDLRVKIANSEKSKTSSYNYIKGQLKEAWLTNNIDAFAELYAAGCIRFPDREAKIAEVMFNMITELEKEGVLSREQVLKYSSVPEEYFVKGPRVVDSNRKVLIELDTVTKPNVCGPQTYEELKRRNVFVDDRIRYVAKKIQILENTHREIRSTLEHPPQVKIDGQYAKSVRNFSIRGRV